MEAHILIVDDNIVTQKSIAQVLQAKSCKITFADDGSDALEKCLSAKYDLIFMDNQMPKMNGIAAIKKIRSNGLNQDTCAVFVTADSFLETTIKDLGFSDYIKKPFNKENISAAYDRLVSKSHSNTKSDTSNENKKINITNTF